MAMFVMFCLCLSVKAQYDDNYDVEEWTLDFEEEEAPKPQHKEYKNTLYLQYSPSRYQVSDNNRVKFNEFALGYSRNIQVLDIPLEREGLCYCSFCRSIRTSHCYGTRILGREECKYYGR